MVHWNSRHAYYQLLNQRARLICIPQDDCIRTRLQRLLLILHLLFCVNRSYTHTKDPQCWQNVDMNFQFSFVDIE